MEILFCLVCLLFSTLTNGQTGAPPTDGNLQCQCTCTSFRLPNTNIYTEGNMNIVKKEVATQMPPKVTEKDASSSLTVPKVDGTTMPINKEVTQFQDVAVSMIRNSLGSRGDRKVVNKPETNTMEASPPRINWQHSASSNDVIENQTPTDRLNTASQPMALYQEGSSFRKTETTINENVNENSSTGKLLSPLPNTDINPTKMPETSKPNVVESKMIDNMPLEKDLSNSKSSVPSKDTANKNTDQTSLDRNAAIGSLGSFSNSMISDNSDKVAADIGFVLDGSAPEPILGGVMSGYGGGSLGTGYFVENIGSKPSKGYFVDTNLNTNADSPKLLDSPSNPSASVVQKSAKNRQDISKPDTTKTTNNEITGNQLQRNEVKNGGTAIQNNNGKKQVDNNKTPVNNLSTNSSNMKRTMNNDKQGPTSTSNKETSTNRGQNNDRKWNSNSMDKPRRLMNNRNRFNSNNNNNNNNNNWRNNNKQNNNKQNNNNRNVWRKEQMKPFNFLQDQKQNTGMGWNNNGQWGNWGTTTVSYAMMGMDPLLFLGQHQL